MANKLTKLEALRGAAATYVLAGHAHIIPGDRFVIGRLGQEAVMAFFLVSGFVIYYSSCAGQRTPTAKQYLVSRIRRIYPIFVFALLFSYALFSLTAGTLIDPHWGQVVGNLLMLQDNGFLKSGVWFDCYMGDTPLWSLAYEVWFYALFLVIISFCADKQRNLLHIAGTISIFSAVFFTFLPNAPALYLSYFITWWAGVEFAREFERTGHVTFKGQRATLLWMAALAIWWLALTAYRHVVVRQQLLFGVEPVLQLRHVCAALALGIIGILWHRFRFAGFNTILGWGTRMAPISYAVYVLHYPLLLYFESRQLATIPRFLMTITIVLPLAYLLEVVVQRQINLATDRWFGLRRSPDARRVTELGDAPTPP